MKNAAILLITFTLPAAWAADWPQLRGPQRTGISQETGLLKEWPRQGPRLLWQLSDIGDGYGPPSVVGGRIFVMSNRGMENEFVQALSVEDGKTIWTARLGGVGNPNQQPPYPMARSDAHRGRRHSLRHELRWRPGVARSRVRKSALA